MNGPHVGWKALIMVMVLASCASLDQAGALPAPTSDPLRNLDTYIAQAVDDWGIVGLSIAVVKDDEVVFANGYGLREVGGPERVDEHTLFAIGSNTKLFTAVGAGLMVDAGKLNWNDPAALHLPGFQLYDPYVSREITIRDLLSHRSGLGRRGDMLWYGSEYDRDEILRRVRYLEPNASFRAEFGYQNIMFLAAGEATAAAAGQGWDELMEERIFQPLGMTRSNTSTKDLAGDPNVATPHINIDGRPVPVPWRNIDNVAPAGSINSSAREMADWLRMLLAEGSLEGRRLIERTTLQEIFSPQTISPFTPDTLFPDVHFAAYGLGMGMRSYVGNKILVHTGGIDGMLSLAALLPEENLGVVVLTNTTGRNNLFTALMYSVFDRYLGMPDRDWSGTFLRRAEDEDLRAAEARSRAEEERVIGTHPSLAAEEYAGLYRHPMYGEASVRWEDGNLVLRRGPAFTGDLQHWHYDTYRAEWRHPGLGRALITFTLNFAGEVNAMQIEGLGEFERAPDQTIAVSR